AKTNRPRPSQGLAFRLEQTIVAEGIIGSRVVWEGQPVSITANEVLAAEVAGIDKTTTQDAKEFLQGALAGGPVAAKDLERIARDHGISAKSLRTAREDMKVRTSRDGFGPGSKSLWSLAPYLPSTP